MVSWRSGKKDKIGKGERKICWGGLRAFVVSFWPRTKKEMGEKLMKLPQRFDIDAECRLHDTARA
jgi:hypothetical protein